jgi:hypothetical protein
MSFLADLGVEILAYVLSWRTWFCIFLALLVAFAVCSFEGLPFPHLDIFIVAGIVGLAAGLVWEWRFSR